MTLQKLKFSFDIQKSIYYRNEMDLTRPTSPTADHLISLKEIKTGNVHLDQMVRLGQVSSENVKLNPQVNQIYGTQ